MSFTQGSWHHKMKMIDPTHTFSTHSYQQWRKFYQKKKKNISNQWIFSKINETIQFPEMNRKILWVVSRASDPRGSSYTSHPPSDTHTSNTLQIPALQNYLPTYYTTRALCPSSGSRNSSLKGEARGTIRLFRAMESGSDVPSRHQLMTPTSSVLKDFVILIISYHPVKMTYTRVVFMAWCRALQERWQSGTRSCTMDLNM
jgi:hypothetical protein